MATKSITITHEAYERLVTFKEPQDSFSDVVYKLTQKYSLLDLVGVLSQPEAEELKRSIQEVRKRARKQVDRTAAHLQ